MRTRIKPCAAFAGGNDRREPFNTTPINRLGEGRVGEDAKAPLHGGLLSNSPSYLPLFSFSRWRVALSSWEADPADPPKPTVAVYAQTASGGVNGQQLAG